MSLICHVRPSEDNASTMLYRRACMLWIISRSFFSPHFDISITLVIINLAFIKLFSRILVVHSVLLCNFQSGLSITLAFGEMASIVLLPKSLLSVELWKHLPPAQWGLSVMSLIVFFFGDLLHSSYKVSVINYCCFRLTACSTLLAHYSNRFFLFRDILNCCIGYAQCLSNGSHRFFSASKWLTFPP